jgi:hypothetical protein
MRQLCGRFSNGKSGGGTTLSIGAISYVCRI